MSTFLSFTSIDLLFPHLLQLLHLPLVNSPSGLTAQLFSRLTHREQQRQRTLNTGPYFYFVSSFGFVVLLCVLASPVGYDGSYVSVGFWSLRWLYIHFFLYFSVVFFFKYLWSVVDLQGTMSRSAEEVNKLTESTYKVSVYTTGATHTHTRTLKYTQPCVFPLQSLTPVLLHLLTEKDFYCYFGESLKCR